MPSNPAKPSRDLRRATQDQKAIKSSWQRPMSMALQFFTVLGMNHDMWQAIKPGMAEA